MGLVNPRIVELQLLVQKNYHINVTIIPVDKTLKIVHQSQFALRSHLSCVPMEHAPH